MSRVSKAFTLLEVLIASSLAAVLFFVLVSMGGQVSGIVSKTVVLNELQQLAEMTGRKLVRQVSYCDAGGAAFQDKPELVALALHPVEDVTSSAKKVYAEHLTLYAWQPGHELLEIKGSPLTAEQRFQPIRLGGAAMEAMLVGNHPTKTFCTNVAQLKLVSSDGGFPVTLKLTLEKSAARYGRQTITFERPLCLRNTY
ncbi:hypothetical protein JST97_34700 [bacterium]|nr:hypothetical protein [bacterium]